MTIGDESGETLTLLPAPDPVQLHRLLSASEVRAFGADIRPEYGQDAGGQRRTRVLILHPDAAVVEQTRDALLREGKRLGLRVFLV